MTVATATLAERITLRLSRGDRALLESASERTEEAPSEFARRVIVAATVGVLTGDGEDDR